MASGGDDRDAAGSATGAVETAGDVAAGDVAVDRLREAADRVGGRLSRLPTAGWRAAREEVRAAAQALVDADADVEGEPRRELPRLRGDAALADQLAVAADDLARAAAPRSGDPADGGAAAPAPALPPAAVLAAVEAGVRVLERLESALRAR